MTPLGAEPEELIEDEEEAIAVAKRMGSSSMSDTLSTFRDSIIAFLRWSRREFSVFDLLYFCEKRSAFSSSSGTSSRSLEAEDVIAGRYSRSVHSAFDVAMTDLCDLEESAWSESRLLFADCVRAWGSVVDKADKESEVSRER